MPPTKLLSLPVVTALNRILDGHYDGKRRLGIGINRHAFLDDFFGENGIEVADAPSISKKIRATVERLNSLPEEHNLLRKLVEQAIDPRYYRHSEEGQHEASLAYLNEVLRADKFELRQVGDVYRLTAVGMNATAASVLVAKANSLDLVSVRDDFERAVAQADRDPSDAITSACATVESVCKCILDEMGKPYPTKKDIQGLVTEVAKHLNLSPGRDDLPVEWQADIRAILSGLFSVISGIGALRTHAGDAHGRGKKPVSVDSRIARLAIHAASTVSLFYIETWQRISEQKQ